MKKLLSLLLLLVSCLPVVAQLPAVPDTVPGRFYVGIGVGNMTYYPQQMPHMRSGFTPVGSVHGGYWINKRVSVQLGLTYGKVEVAELSSGVGPQGEYILHKDDYRTQTFAAQLTGRYTLTNPYKRLQLYAMGSVTRMWSNTSMERTTTMNGESTVHDGPRLSGLNTFATAGLGASYSLGSRLEFYAEAPLLHQDVSGHTIVKNGAFKAGLHFRL